MPDPNNTVIDRLSAIADPVEAARAAQDWLDTIRATMPRVEELRNQRIRAARALPQPLTVNRLAVAVCPGLKAGDPPRTHIVIDATRKKKA